MILSYFFSQRRAYLLNNKILHRSFSVALAELQSSYILYLADSATGVFRKRCTETIQPVIYEQPSQQFLQKFVCAMVAQFSRTNQKSHCFEFTTTKQLEDNSGNIKKPNVNQFKTLPTRFYAVLIINKNPRRAAAFLGILTNLLKRKLVLIKLKNLKQKLVTFLIIGNNIFKRGIYR